MKQSTITNIEETIFDKLDLSQFPSWKDKSIKEIKEIVQKMTVDLNKRYTDALLEELTYPTRTEAGVPFLGHLPLVQSIREAGDAGRPAAMQTATPLEQAFEDITKNVVEEVVKRNDDLPPTEAIKITTMAGCSAVK